MIRITKGNILETPADIRVNAVNCVGIMGAGIALVFKNRYPKMFEEYQKVCKVGKVRPGKLHIWKGHFGDWIINFPTKRHWREPSRYEDIEAGLITLHTYLLEQSKKTSNLKVALPALGCGNGGLDWKIILSMIKTHLSDLEADIMVIDPTDEGMLEEVREDGLQSETTPKKIP